VQAERDQLSRVVQETNTILAALVPEHPLTFELIRWETHTRPGLGSDPQDVVLQQLSIEDVDIFIGIMWRRFGTPTARAESGTEEEFRIAREAWRANRRPREVLFYFCQESAPPPGNEEEAQQQLNVAHFRQELMQEALVRDYADHSSFADLVRLHLVQVASTILRPGERPSSVADRTSQITPESDLQETRCQLLRLAKEYGHLRRHMDPGDARTRRLEVVTSKMTTLALSADPLVPKFTRHPSPGVRLAAVATLETVPRAEFLEWLADRLLAEKPFVGYHAALALLTAARRLEPGDLRGVRAAIVRAKSFRLPPDSDRDITLRYAEAEVDRRMSTAEG
jgi:hypothetical protein